MPVDIRATVTCSLGTLISANVSDGYVQGSGLIQTRGKAEIKGLIRPAIGTGVTFSYTKSGMTRTVPRKLRVLSCFPDPFRGITTVMLGCLFTYKQNESGDKIVWVGEGEEEPYLGDIIYTTSLVEALPVVYASQVARTSLSKLGLADTNLPPLVARYVVEAGSRYDFSSGYVNILSGVLASESYCGYLDENEAFQWFSLDVEGGTGPVLGTDTLIDIGPISGGQQPGGKVVVRSRRKKLTGATPADGTEQALPPTFLDPKPNDPTEEPFPTSIGGGGRWDSSSTSNTSTAAIAYTDPNTGESATQVVAISQNIQETTAYRTVNGRSVVASRSVDESSSGGAVAGNIISSYLSAGLPAAAVGSGDSTTTETFEYDSKGNEVYHEVQRWANGLIAAGSVGVPFVVNGEAVAIPSGSFLLEKTVTRTVTARGYRRSVVERYGPWIQTVYGQQALAESGSDITSASAAASLIEQALQGVYLIDYSVNTGYTSETAQEAPGGFVVGVPKDFLDTAGEEEIEVEFEGGNQDDGSVLELDLPIPADDYVEERLNQGNNPEYYAIEAANAQLAVKYGRVQNRLILGNRDGMFFQVAAENMPSAPFSPVFVQAAGLTALYRTNGTNWTMDANGIVASTDGLFWGGVAGTPAQGESFWFPVAPGVTALPTTPPVVNGEMTATTVVPPWNETVSVVGRVRSTVRFIAVDYALQLLTELDPLKVRTIATGFKVMPLVATNVAAVAPAVSTGVIVGVPLTDAAISSYAPVVAGGASVSVPQSVTQVVGYAPESVGIAATLVGVPIGALSLAASTPAVASGASVAVPSADLAVGVLAPTRPVVDANFSSVSLLLHCNGTDASTSFPDNSSNSFTVTVGGNAQVDTAQSKFGGAAAYFDGSGDYLETPSNSAFTFGTGDFTVEAWLRITTSSTDRAFVDLGIAFLYFDTARRPYYYLSGNKISGSTVAADTWHHVAICRGSGSTRLFIGGTQVGSTYSDTNNYSATKLRFGQLTSGSYSLLGWLDDIRVTKGVARYTSSFTPPAAAFPDA